MSTRQTVTVQRRREPEDFWMVWVDDHLVGSVHSQDELDELVRSLAEPGPELVFEGDAERDLRQNGPLPPGSAR